MNILFYGTNASNPTLGGIARISYNLICYFQSQGINCYAITKYMGNTQIKENFQLYFPNENLYSDENNRYLRKIILEKKIDIVINQLAICNTDVDFLYSLKKYYPTLIIVSCIHNPILNQIRNYPYLKEFALKEKHLGFIFEILATPILRYVYNYLGIIIRKKQYVLNLMQKSNSVLMLTPGHMQELLDIVKNDFIEKISYIPNCINLEKDTNIGKENIVLWIGSVNTSVKRIDYMLDIWKEFSVQNTRWQLMVLGDGPDLVWAKKNVLSNNIKNVSFLGRVNPIPFYKKAKVSCVTSSYESFSMVIIESQKYGVVPIVNNSFPSASYLINNGYNGCLVKMFDKKMFTQSLKDITSNQHLLDKMRVNCLNSVSKFSVSNIGPIWIKYLENLKSVKYKSTICL